MHIIKCRPTGMKITFLKFCLSVRLFICLWQYHSRTIHPIYHETRNVTRVCSRLARGIESQTRRDTTFCLIVLHFLWGNAHSIRWQRSRFFVASDSVCITSEEMYGSQVQSHPNTTRGNRRLSLAALAGRPAASRGVKLPLLPNTRSVF